MEWISVKDRLPEPYCLIFLKTENSFYLGNFLLDGTFMEQYTGFIIKDGVKWAHLPEE